MKNIKINSRISFRWDFFEANEKESTFSYFNKKASLASDKKSDGMSKKAIQHFTILFAKDARLKSKIIEFVNVTSFFVFAKFIIIFKFYLFYDNISLITICLRWLSLVANFLDDCSVEWLLNYRSYKVKQIITCS